MLPSAYAVDIPTYDSIPGDGTVQPDEGFDYQIVNIYPNETNTEIVFSNADQNGTNPFDTTYANARQYIKLMFHSNRIDARITVYTENTASNASPKYTGPRALSDPAFNATTDEETYDTEEPLAERHNLKDGEKPIPVTGGMVGQTETKEALPVVWQIHDEVPATLPNYDYQNPVEPDPSRPAQYRNPTDRWGFIVDKTALDYHYALDWQTGHFAVDPDNGDPDHHNWVPSSGYRTLAVPIDGHTKLLLGGFPGKRDANGFRIDTEGQPLEYGENGLPVNPGLSDIPVSADDDLYLFLAANFLGKHAQDFSSNKLVIEYYYIDGDTGQRTTVKREIPLRATLISGKEFGITIKAKNAGETTSGLIFSNTNPNGNNPPGTKAVNSRQYLEVTARTNVFNGRFVVYTNNTALNASPKLTALREKAASFTATLDEKPYVHPLADTTGRQTFMNGRKPIPVTGGLVGVTDPRVAVPVVWQVYDNEDTDSNLPGIQYPNYNFADPLSPEATDRWAFLMEKFSWDFDWAVEFATGHFKIDSNCNDEDGCGDPNNHYWLPTAGYRTLADGYNNLGGFPGPRDAAGNRIPNKLLQGTSPFYVFFGANYFGKSAQTYRTNKIVLEYTEG